MASFITLDLTERNRLNHTQILVQFVNEPVVLLVEVLIASVVPAPQFSLILCRWREQCHQTGHINKARRGRGGAEEEAA